MSLRKFFFGRESFFTAKHPVEKLRYGIGCFGVWLCNHFTPRPCTDCERAESTQYCQLMIDSLKGQIPWYGRDAARPTIDRIQ
jgi:hypothetical protein